MSKAGGDLITGYLAELGAGLRVPPGEAELIMAEAEDHLRETAATGLAVGMTELEAAKAAISSFGPVRAVIRAHRRRAVTPAAAALAGWKLAGLLAATVGAGGLATVLWLHFDPGWAPGVRVVTAGLSLCQCAPKMAMPVTGPAVTVLTCAAMAAGGVALLATRRLAIRRLTRRGAAGWDPLSPAVTASFFLLVTALLFALNMSGAGASTGHMSWDTPLSEGSSTITAPLIPGLIVAGCLAVAVGYGVQAALRRVRRSPDRVRSLGRVLGRLADRGSAGRAYV
ncbi:MAG: HAAS signaling domain-containing protein [Streptosporangiaceae bacterium]